jgi:hypothetical protein
VTALPPEDGPKRDESLGRPHKPDDDRSWVPKARSIALIGAIVGALVIGVILTASEDVGSPASPEPESERGVACPFLRFALEAFDAGDDTGFANSVRVAARQAELTLERSGQVFGRPEEIALQLRSLVEREPASQTMRDLLLRAKAYCTDLQLWSSPAPQGEG